AGVALVLGRVAQLGGALGHGVLGRLGIRTRGPGPARVEVLRGLVDRLQDQTDRYATLLLTVGLAAVEIAAVLEVGALAGRRRTGAGLADATFDLAAAALVREQPKRAEVVGRDEVRGAGTAAVVGDRCPLDIVARAVDRTADEVLQLERLPDRHAAAEARGAERQLGVELVLVTHLERLDGAAGEGRRVVGAVAAGHAVVRAAVEQLDLAALVLDEHQVARGLGLEG